MGKRSNRRKRMKRIQRRKKLRGKWLDGDDWANEGVAGSC